MSKKQNTDKSGKKENLDNITEEVDANPSRSRDFVDAADGDDAIEIEVNQYEKFKDSSYYGAQDGEEGQIVDYEDLPSEQLKNGNYYDPALGSGKSNKDDRDETPEEDGMHISNAADAGITDEVDELIERNKKE